MSARLDRLAEHMRELRATGRGVRVNPAELAWLRRLRRPRVADLYPAGPLSRWNHRYRGGVHLWSAPSGATVTLDVMSGQVELNRPTGERTRLDPALGMLDVAMVLRVAHALLMVTNIGDGR